MIGRVRDICGPVLAARPYITAAEGVCAHQSCLQGPVSRPPARRSHSLPRVREARGPVSGQGHLPLTLGQGDTTVKVGEGGREGGSDGGGRREEGEVQVGGGEGEKNPSPPLAPCPAPAKMNQNWKTTCKVCLIQEHLQYADVFFCTLCLLNCL